ncbi:hypothetical protein QTP86_017159, partial [Hemibagrus guttatus]
DWTNSMDSSSGPPDPLRDLVADLRQALAAVPAPAPTPPATTSVNTVTTSSALLCASPTAQPAPYSGSAEDCNRFLLKCSLVLEMQPHLYPTERSKVAFIITQLHSQALLWAESLWSQNSPHSAVLLKEVFGKPSWDSLIGEELLPRGRIYPLSILEEKAMEEYIKEALAQGYIHLSTSPAASSFFFVAKKDGGLRPCIDYRALNRITVKFRYPLPLVPAALEHLRGATIFTKLDLRSAYNLIRIRKGDE